MLDGLESVGGDLTINRNDALTDLDGLDSLESVGGILNISYNDALCQSLVDACVAGITVSGTVYTGDNKDDC